MKKLMLIIAVALFMGCEKNPVVPSHPILGDWRAQSCQVSEYVDNVLVYELFINYLHRNRVIRFIDGGIGVWICDDVVDRWFSWETDADNQNLLIVEDVGESLSYKIQIEADTLLYTREPVYNTNWTRNRVVFSYIAFRIN